MMELLRKLDRMRMVLGMLMVVDGYPLIFFFKESLGLAPGSTVFTAVFLALGFVLMVPFTVLRRLYRPNETLFWLCLVFIGLSIFYMYAFNADLSVDKTQDLMYYAFTLIFLLLLINTPNDVIDVFIPVVIAFTLISNLALVYALITDPTWVLGSRAAIQYGEGEGRSGNPHVFARNAFMGVIAGMIWVTRAETSFVSRVMVLFAAVFSMAILLMTQTRSSIVALLLAIICFLAFNVRPHTIRQTVRGLTRPASLVLLGLVVGGIAVFISRNQFIFDLLYGYVVGFIERNTENLYALLGIQLQGVTYEAQLDASAATRSVSFTFLRNVVMDYQERLFFGYGYKYSYLDLPFVEALLNQGFLGGFLFYLAFIVVAGYRSLNAMIFNYNPVSVFLAYFFVYLFVQQFTNGRPYEIWFWHPFCLMIRFMGVEHLVPGYRRFSLT